MAAWHFVLGVEVRACLMETAFACLAEGAAAWAGLPRLWEVASAIGLFPPWTGHFNHASPPALPAGP